jgi:hypothetical protein
MRLKPSSHPPDRLFGIIFAFPLHQECSSLSKRGCIDTAPLTQQKRRSAKCPQLGPLAHTNITDMGFKRTPLLPKL